MPIEVTNALAEFAVNTRYADIPVNVRENAKLAIADSLGAVLAGTGEPSTVILRERAAEESGPQRWLGGYCRSG